MIEIVKTSDGVGIKMQGRPEDIVREMLAIVNSVVNNVIVEKHREEFINELPDLIRAHRQSITTTIKVDLDALNRGKEE